MHDRRRARPALAAAEKATRASGPVRGSGGAAHAFAWGLDPYVILLRPQPQSSVCFVAKGRASSALWLPLGKLKAGRQGKGVRGGCARATTSVPPRR